MTAAAAPGRTLAKLPPLGPVEVDSGDVTAKEQFVPAAEHHSLANILVKQRAVSGVGFAAKFDFAAALEDVAVEKGTGPVEEPHPAQTQAETAVVGAAAHHNPARGTLGNPVAVAAVGVEEIAEAGMNPRSDCSVVAHTDLEPNPVAVVVAGVDTHSHLDSAVEGSGCTQLVVAAAAAAGQDILVVAELADNHSVAVAAVGDTSSEVGRYKARSQAVGPDKEQIPGVVRTLHCKIAIDRT